MKNSPKFIEMRRVGELVPYARNARTHSKSQIKQIAESIRRFGFTNPVLLAYDNSIIAGHGRVEAAKLLGLEEVPTIRLSYLSAEERRAYILADNKLALDAGWNSDILAEELQALIDIDFPVELTGFSMAEIDIELGQAKKRSGRSVQNVDELVAPPDKAITRVGDIWTLGQHRLICRDARRRPTLEALMADERANLIFTDPPYNIAIDGNVCGTGRIRHREFVMATGEMTKAQFTDFLTETLTLAAEFSKDGSIGFAFMDWRHLEEIIAAGRKAFTELKNVCVWNKTNAGLGSFYRSKYELVFVFKKGKTSHINNFGLGETGRYRTNVWDYAGASSGGEMRENLALHPTPKPVELIVDAIEDCSRRGDIVLDVFGGSGSTLIAAEQCDRKCRMVELDPAYCDVIITRFMRVTGQNVYLDASGKSFDAVALERNGDAEEDAA